MTLVSTVNLVIDQHIRRLFWAHLVGDAFWAAASGNEPRV